LADFATASQLTTGNPFRTEKITSYEALPPEHLHEEDLEYGGEIDIWAFGILCH
jgi:hypothetical protein